MKIIARLLQASGIVATFVAAAYVMRYTVDPGSCKRIVIGALGWIPIIMLALVLGFGAAARGELSRFAQLWLWPFAAVFFGVHSRILHFYDYGSYGKKWQGVTDVFIPEIRLGYALEALSPFFVDIVRYWMPFAAVLAILAFGINLYTFIGQRHKQAEQGAAEEAV